MTREELIEYLANLEHERWSNWQAYVHNLCIKNEDGSLTIPKKYVDHWNWEIALKYKDLPDNIKESDRKEVYKIMFLFDHMFNENKTLQKTLQTQCQSLQTKIDEAIDYIKPKLKLKNKNGFPYPLFKRAHINHILKILERTDK